MYRNFLLSILSSLLLFSCTNLSELEKTSSIHNENFTEYLAREYLDFSRKEANSYDWFDSDFFARKGLMASQGIEVPPEHYKNWKIPKQYINELDQASKRLNTILATSLKISHPQETAKAQFSYDCWLEQQEEKWQEDDIDDCKINFLKEISLLEQELHIIMSKENHSEIDNNYTIYFDFDSDYVDSYGIETVKEIRKLLKNRKNYNINLDGYTDTAGPYEYNIFLSKKRADSVEEELIKEGLNRNMIMSNYYGETLPAVNTANNIPERLNRRVEINVYSK